MQPLDNSKEVAAEELTAAEALQDAVNALFDALYPLKHSREKVATLLAENLTDQETKTLRELDTLLEKLNGLYDMADARVNTAAAKYMTSVTGLVLGDIVDTETPRSGKYALRIERAWRSSDGTLELSGPRLLKTGQVGKRWEYAYPGRFSCVRRTP